MVDAGKFVKINYVGRIKGTDQIFDLTDEAAAKKAGIFNEKATYGPMTVVVGAGHVLKGLENVLSKMKVGEKKEKLLVHPEDAFGKRDKDRVKLVPESTFKSQGVAPRQGLIVNMGGGLLGKIQSVTNGRITVDFNHPLAGRELEYTLEVLEEVDDPAEQLKGLAALHLRGQQGNAISAKVSKTVAEVELSWVLTHARMKLLAEEVKKHVAGGGKIKTVKFVYSFK